jgi:hypothetical protein
MTAAGTFSLDTNTYLTSSGLSGMTAGYIPLAASGTTITGNSHLDDGVTTAGTVTSTEPINAPSLGTTGTTPGKIAVTAGTGNIPALAANSAGFAAPSTGGTSYLVKLPATITAGYCKVAAPATGDNVNEAAMSCTSIASGDLPAATPTAAGAVIMVANTTFTTSTGSVSANTCNGTVQVAMTGVTTSMAFIISASSDTSGITGWGSTGGLILDVWPTAGYLNYKICDQTAATISTPGAVTFNVGAR